MNTKTNQGNKKGLIAGSVIGSVVGATATLLLTPKNGKEVRTGITEQSTRVLNKGKEFGGSTKERMMDNALVNKFKKNTDAQEEEQSEKLHAVSNQEPNDEQQEDNDASKPEDNDAEQTGVEPEPHVQASVEETPETDESKPSNQNKGNKKKAGSKKAGTTVQSDDDTQ
ncbi:YtxH domain-containing protein [Thalassobacillus hwangdonensis]|uniref:YtxH domain-containing protein n=1 Tax=Thalassobacillus hwangdonensis TaxID=546108 RepID=A0ABW3L3L5_9BACI